jgi:hypothetical protein
MIRLFGVALAGALALSPASAGQIQLTKDQYLTAIERAIAVPDADRLFDEVVGVESRSTWPQSRADWLRSNRRLRSEMERVANRLGSLPPPAEVAEIHADWISSLRTCAARFRRLEDESPLDALIAAREIQPCLDAHREICERFYAKDYSFG